jgi:hypothetical protein
MNITKVNFMNSEVDEEENGEEEEQDEEQEGFFDPPSTAAEVHAELLVDTTTANKPSIVPVPYPNSKRELRILSYGTVGPVPKKLSRELRCLQISSIHKAYINKQTK